MTNYVLNEQKMFADISDGAAIIINSETGVYYGLNSFGTQIYENLINGVSSEDILNEIKGLSEGTEKAYVDFINFMLENEILLPDTETNSTAEIAFDTGIAQKDNFLTTIQAYLDAQELLLADPIHEVKEDEGWSPEKSSLNEDLEDVARRKAKIV